MTCIVPKDDLTVTLQGGVLCPLLSIDLMHYLLSLLSAILGTIVICNAKDIWFHSTPQALQLILQASCTTQLFLQPLSTAGVNYWESSELSLPIYLAHR